MTLGRLTRTALPFVLTALSLTAAAQQAETTLTSVPEHGIKENIVAALKDDSSFSQGFPEEKTAVELQSSAEGVGSSVEKVGPQEEKANELSEADHPHDESVKSTLV